MGWRIYGQGFQYHRSVCSGVVDMQAEVLKISTLELKGRSLSRTHLTYNSSQPSTALPSHTGAIIFGEAWRWRLHYLELSSDLNIISAVTDLV